MLEKSKDFKGLYEALLVSGCDDEDIEQLVVLAPKIAELCFATRPVVAPSYEGVKELGWIEIDPAIPFQKRLSFCDFDGGVEPEIISYQSSLSRKVRRRIYLYDFGNHASDSQIKRRMRANGHRPCDVDDGVGIAFMFPEVNRENPLVLLDGGSVCLTKYGRRCAPCFGMDWNGKCKFDLSLLPGHWISNYFFPAVGEEVYVNA